MAFSKVESAPTKLSFAKIAAMPAPNILPALPNTNQDLKSKAAPIAKTATAVEEERELNFAPSAIDSDQTQLRSQNEVEGVQVALKNMSILDASSIRGAVEAARDQYEDGQSNVSSSSLKQQSFDTKSIASVTTFAMDEKESIRPDDSASVRAADDEDSNPGISRHSSFQHEGDVLASAHRAPMRVAVPSVSMAARRYPGLALANPPRFGEMPVSPADDVRADEIEAPQPAVSMPSTEHPGLPALTMTPDEKLIEALASPKDRLPLLQLEEKFVTFLTYGREDVLELPPQNSFTRLLTHKLADYYGLAHQVTEDNTSVRVFRTQSNPLPLSLAEMAKSIPTGPQQLNAAMQVKIMRRVQLGRQMSAGTSTAASSSVPSKATSENGADIYSEEGLQSPQEGAPGREKLKTREEREAQYKAVRDRIFGDFQESAASENGSTGETSASMSRSSSTSGGKKKSRKSKTPKDDSFTRRSEFIAYGPMHMQQNFSNGYGDLNYSDPFQNPPHTAFPGHMYGQAPMQQYPQYDPNMSYGGPNVYGSNNHVYSGSEGWANMQQPSNGQMFPNQSISNYQHQAQAPIHVKDQYGQNMQPHPSASAWTQPQLPNTFSQNSMGGANAQWQNFNNNLNMQVQGFQYAQNNRAMYVGETAYAGQPSMLPAYNNARSLFNPQTRSFVPNNSPGRGGSRQPRKKAGQSDIIPKNKDATISSFHASDHSSKLREDSLQQKYGTPANLPKKPPASQVSPLFAKEVNPGATPS